MKESLAREVLERRIRPPVLLGEGCWLVSHSQAMNRGVVAYPS